MKITIIAVGKIKEKFYRDAVSEYTKRLSRYCKFDIIEIEDEKTPDQASDTEKNRILQKEGARINACIRPNAYVIATALEGKKMDSIEFSNEINQICISGNSHIVFIIGGSLGLDGEIKKAADRLVSFSDMTFPHQLMRVILSEQIYRAFRIINHEPYHK